MRADRLLSLLMLLQTRGRMTAQALARELEVSERTIYRDIEALSACGVPVYADRGPGGGCALLDSYRTTLTGLTQPEVRALFMLSIPAPLDQLGVSQELKGALLKLSAALPATRRDDEARIRQRIYLDSTWWFQSPEPVPHLQTLYQAVWQDRRLDLTLRLTLASFFETHVTRTVEPYGLVAKANVWHLVCAARGTLRTYRVSDILDAKAGEHFQRPDDFELAAYWQTWCADFETRQPHYPVTLRIAPQFIAWLPHYFGHPIRELIEQAAPDLHGIITLVVPFESLEDARSRILGWGRAVEVIEPEALRRSVADFAEQIVWVYSRPTSA